jgi:hypothetical protein
MKSQLHVGDLCRGAEDFASDYLRNHNPLTLGPGEPPISAKTTFETSDFEVSGHSQMRTFLHRNVLNLALMGGPPVASRTRPGTKSALPLRSPQGFLAET